jgi:Hypoxia induced protein conserved region
VFSMAKGGEFNRKYGNKLMRLRIALQGLAILLFIVFMLAYRS